MNGWTSHESHGTFLKRGKNWKDEKNELLQIGSSKCVHMFYPHITMHIAELCGNFLDSKQARVHTKCLIFHIIHFDGTFNSVLWLCQATLTSTCTHTYWVHGEMESLRRDVARHCAHTPPNPFRLEIISTATHIHTLLCSGWLHWNYIIIVLSQAHSTADKQQHATMLAVDEYRSIDTRSLRHSRMG